MKVSELIKMLKAENPKSEVCIFTQSGRKTVTELWRREDVVVITDGD